MTEPIQIEGVETCISSESSAIRKRARSTTIYSEEEAYSTRICSPLQRPYSSLYISTSHETPQNIPTSTGESTQDISFRSHLVLSHQKYNPSNTIVSSRPTTNKLSSSFIQYQNLRNHTRYVPPTIFEEDHSSSTHLPMMTPSPSLENFMCIDNDMNSTKSCHTETSIQSSFEEFIQSQEITNHSYRFIKKKEAEEDEYMNQTNQKKSIKTINNPTFHTVG